MHGSDDKITSYKASRNFTLNAGNNTYFKEWPGCYHELHNEPNKEEVFRFIIDWLNNLFKFKNLKNGI